MTPSSHVPEKNAAASQPFRWTVSPPLALLILVFLVGAIYYPGLRAPFVFDDENQITFNNNLRQWWQPKNYAFEARPFGYLTFALNYAAGRLNPWGYRLVNVAIHAAATCVLFDVTRRILLLPQFAKRYQERATELALVIAAIWGAHPLQTSAVTYVIQRFESLMGLFFLLALYALLRGALSKAHKWHWFALACTASVLGGATKEVIAVLPLVAVLFDRAFLASTWRQVVRERWLWHLAFWSAPLTAIAISYNSLRLRTDVSAGFGLKSISAWEYLRSQPAVLLHYLRLTIWPDKLILDHGWPVTPANDLLGIYGSGGLILGLVIAGVILYLRRPALGFLILTWFLILAPTSSILPIADLCFEHRPYLSLAAMVVLLVIAADGMLARFANPQPAGKIAAVVAMLVVAALGMRTMQRNTDYLSPLKLWSQSADYNPRNSRAHNNAGKELARIPGREPEAIARYQQAMAALPTSAMFPDNLGTVYARLAQYEQAIPWFEKGVQVEPTYLAARLHLSKALLLVGRDAEAWQALAETPKNQQGIRDVIQQKAWIRALAEVPEVRLPGEAVSLLEPLAKRDPKFHDPLLRDALALAYAADGRYQDALPLARAAVEFFTQTRQSDLRQLAQKRLARYETDQPWTIALEREHLQSSRRVIKSLPASELP